MDLDYGLMQSSSAGRGWRWVQGRPLPAQGFATDEGGGSVGVWLGSLSRTQMGDRQGEQVLKKVRERNV